MLRFLPLAYLAGIHGFALFAPYLALFLALGHYLQPLLQRRIKLQPVKVNSAPLSACYID